MIGGAHNFFRHLDVYRVDVLKKSFDIFLGVVADAHARRCGFLDDAIVHIGKIHHLQHAVSALVQKAPQNILKHEGAEISDVREIVDGGAAGIDANFARMQRVEGFEAVR